MIITREIFNQVRKNKALRFDKPAGGHIVHIWQWPAKYPLCGKRLINREDIFVIPGSNGCKGCIRQALEAAVKGE